MPVETAARPKRRAATRRTSGASKTAATKSRRKAAAGRKAPAAPANGLPGWGDLGGTVTAKGKARKARSAGRARFLDAAPSLRFGVWTLLACIAMTLYVGHVFATQSTLAELQHARRDNLRLHLTHERLQGAFDRMTGPDQILDRAKALGLEEGIAYGPVIRLDD